MFHSLLSSMEEAQNRQYPTYKADLIAKGQEKARLRKIAAGKAEKGNNKDAEEEAKAGFDEEDLSQVDVHQPHPSFVLSAVTSHLKLAEVEDVRNAMAKAGEPIEMHHALIRGLRRGLAIYTDEVGFACYRRQVQILAQKGRIAVVFSDEALAYGVNMPFRTCLFCGDMGDALTPLIAQQMQGRAGRRGMDVQGNIVYLGLGWEKIEEVRRTAAMALGRYVLILIPSAHLSS
jgi:ATP-dependent RNA helicase DDX60